MKKRITAGITAAMILGAMALTAGAADADPQMEVTYEQATTYTLSIPATVTLTAEGGSAKVGVAEVNTKPDEKVLIKVSGLSFDNDVLLVREGEAQGTAAAGVLSAVTNSNDWDVINGSVVAVFQDMNPTAIESGEGGDGTLNFGPLRALSGEDDPIKAGKYKGTLTFVGEVHSRT